MSLLVLGLVAGISYASYALMKKARSQNGHGARAPKALGPPEERTLATMQVGDVLQHLGTDYLVEGVLTLSDSGRGSRLYRIVDGGDERFLYTAAGAQEPLLLGSAPELEREGPAPDSIEREGQSFRLRARSSAQVIAVGAMGSGRVGDRVKALEYLGPGAARLLLLEWDGRTDAYAGERVALHLFDILPGK